MQLWFWQIGYRFVPPDDRHGTFIVVRKRFQRFVLLHGFEVLRQQFAVLNGYLRNLRMSVREIRIRCLKSNIANGKNVIGSFYFIELVYQKPAAAAILFRWNSFGGFTGYARRPDQDFGFYGFAVGKSYYVVFVVNYLFVQHYINA